MEQITNEKEATKKLKEFLQTSGFGNSDRFVTLNTDEIEIMLNSLDTTHKIFYANNMKYFSTIYSGLMIKQYKEPKKREEKFIEMPKKHFKISKTEQGIINADAFEHLDKDEIKKLGL